MIARMHAVSRVVQRHDLPEEMSALAGMAKPDYVDLFSVTASRASDESPERWARVALEGASPAGRFFVWQVLCGLRLEKRPSPDYVAGWRIADRGENWLRLEAASWFMTAHAVVLVEDEQVSVALFVHYDRPAAALVWPPIAVGHRRAMPVLLRHAVRSMERSRR